MPPIAKVLARIAELTQGKYKNGREAMGALGEVFTKSADANPNYFAVPGRTPEADVGKLSTKHGVPLSLDWADTLGPVKSERLQIDAGGKGRQYLEGYSGLHETQSVKNLTGAMRRDQINLGTDLYGIDSMMAQPGTGNAKKAYPALYEWILAQPDAANITSGLTIPNMARRTNNMVGSLEKFGKRAGDRLLIDSDQLTNVGDPSRFAEYHSLENPEKIGLLNMIMARRAQGMVNHQLKNSAASRQDHPLNVELRSLGLDQGWLPSTDVSSDYFPRLAELLHAAGKTEGSQGPSRVGVDTLRRAAITFDHMGEGLGAGDLATQPYLTDRLARREGGRIPAHTPGALTQTCGCAK